MKVVIGPYKTFYGVYQIVEILRYLGVTERIRERIADWLGETRVNDFLQWLHIKRGERKVKVKIDDHDTFSADETLAHIILPLLIQLKEQDHGSPNVSDYDVPEELQSTQDPNKKETPGEDSFMHDRWDWVLGEMIYAFQMKLTNWGEEFQSGEIDWQFVPDHSRMIPNSKTGEKEPMYKLVKGPNHTFEMDVEGMKRVENRIQNGFRLFGKYYQALWT